ncbi:MAG: hypothetical protein QOE94_1843, partial [Mycobacterium sp.]|nr:hypothetical protein [Mycobacterium sp.]
MPFIRVNCPKGALTAEQKAMLAPRLVQALLLEQETELEPMEVMTDTAAYSDAVFGLFWLLGYQFSPRLADLGDVK